MINKRIILLWLLIIVCNAKNRQEVLDKGEIEYSDEVSYEEISCPVQNSKIKLTREDDYVSLIKPFREGGIGTSIKEMMLISSPDGGISEIHTKYYVGDKEITLKHKAKSSKNLIKPQRLYDNEEKQNSFEFESVSLRLGGFEYFNYIEFVCGENGLNHLVLKTNKERYLVHANHNNIKNIQKYKIEGEIIGFMTSVGATPNIQGFGFYEESFQTNQSLFIRQILAQESLFT
jgi:hypothetical protein